MIDFNDAETPQRSSVEPHTWKVEVMSLHGWRQIAFPNTEAEATKYFEWAVSDYPADHMIRLREGDTVRRFQPAEWCNEQEPKE